MSKELKTLIREEMSRSIQKLDGGVFITYSGLDSHAMYSLRSSLHEAGADMQVVHNRICARAMTELEFDAGIIKEVLKGDTALVFGENPIEAARAVKQQISTGLDIKVKGGFLEGEILQAEDAQKMADLPTREELLSQIAYCFQAGAQRIAGCFQQTYKQIAGCFLSYSEELEEKGGD